MIFYGLLIAAAIAGSLLVIVGTGAMFSELDRQAPRRWKTVVVASGLVLAVVAGAALIFVQVFWIFEGVKA